MHLLTGPWNPVWKEGPKLPKATGRQKTLLGVPVQAAKRIAALPSHSTMRSLQAATSSVQRQEGAAAEHVSQLVAASGAVPLKVPEL